MFEISYNLKASWGCLAGSIGRAQIGQHVTAGMRLIPAECKDGPCNHWGCLKMKQMLNGGHIWLRPSHDQTSFL